jgi:hypothetical protein
LTAQEIMNQYILHIDGIVCELTEIEFYYFDCKNHSDIYVHQNELQKNTSDFLYAHQNSWGNYGGIDLTFGSGTYYGGILIRAIKINNNFVAGPATLRNMIVNTLDKNICSYAEFQKYLDDQRGCICLAKNTTSENFPIFVSRRINLGKKESPEFRNALYRFVRKDMLMTSKCNNFETRSNLKEISKLKAISKLALTYACNEPSTERNILENKILLKHIEDLKQYQV